MIGYASNTGTRRNLAALREHGWRILLTPDNPIWRDGFEHGIDNGAWGAYKTGSPFPTAKFAKLVDAFGHLADFVVVPDIVEGGMKSLDFSRSWLPRLRGCRRLLLPLQDGMSPKDIGATLKEYPRLGLFLGGSTDWKLKEMYAWGMVAHAYDRWYHVGRVNTAKRIRKCAEAGADSFDGTSATRYSCTLPLLEAARCQPRLFTARNEVNHVD